MAHRKDLIVDQGADFVGVIPALDANGDPLTVTSGYTGIAQIRKNYASSNSVSFDVSLDGTDITLTLTANQSAAMPAGRYVYDVELTHTGDGKISRVSEGILSLTPSVSR